MTELVWGVGPHLDLYLIIQLMNMHSLCRGLFAYNSKSTCKYPRIESANHVKIQPIPTRLSVVIYDAAYMMSPTLRR